MRYHFYNVVMNNYRGDQRPNAVQIIAQDLGCKNCSFQQWFV
jgi:hypothetical protein